MFNHLPDIAYRIAVDRVEERLRQTDTGRPLHSGQRRGSREHHRSR